MFGRMASPDPASRDAIARVRMACEGAPQPTWRAATCRQLSRFYARMGHLAPGHRPQSRSNRRMRAAQLMQSGRIRAAKSLGHSSEQHHGGRVPMANESASMHLPMRCASFLAIITAERSSLCFSIPPPKFHEQYIPYCVPLLGVVTPKESYSFADKCKFCA